MTHPHFIQRWLALENSLIEKDRQQKENQAIANKPYNDAMKQLNRDKREIKGALVLCKELYNNHLLPEQFLYGDSCYGMFPTKPQKIGTTDKMVFCMGFARNAKGEIIYRSTNARYAILSIVNQKISAYYTPNISVTSLGTCIEGYELQPDEINLLYTSFHRWQYEFYEWFDREYLKK